MVVRPPNAETDAAAGGVFVPSGPEQRSAGGRVRRGVPKRARPFLWALLGLLVGLMLGTATLATFQASGVIAPPPIGGNLGAEAASDVVLALRQPYLSRLAAERMATVQAPIVLENVRIDVLPNERLRLLGDVPFMGQRWQAFAMMNIGVAERRIRVQVREVQVGTLVLPLDLDAVVAQPINAELARMVDESLFDVIDVATAEDRVIVRLAERR